MKPTHYTCPRCRQEQADHDCATALGSGTYELHASITMAIPSSTVNAWGPGLSGSEAATQAWSRLMEDHESMKEVFAQALRDDAFTLRVEPVYVDIAEPT